MDYRLTESDFSRPAALAQSAWRRVQLAEDLGHCTTDFLMFDDGLGLAYTDYNPLRDLQEDSHIEREARSLTVTVALEGTSNTVGVDGRRFEFVSGHSTIAAFSKVRGERRFPAHQSIRQLRLIAGETVLAKYGFASLLDSVQNNQTARHLHFGKHNAAVQTLANTLVHQHGTAANLLDLQIAALSLLSEHIRPLLPQAQPVGRMRSEDQDRMLHARDVLMSQYHQPLTIAYLCATVGTNELKLKQGFHELFGTTPFRMLTDIRMRKALELLESGQRVSAVAYKVGYQHLSSFSAAFGRYYSRTPKSVSKSI
jgi:AraC-like DNA-binding protein